MSRAKPNDPVTVVVPRLVCRICGEAVVAKCGWLYPDWIVVLPAEIQNDDLFHGTDGRLYSVKAWHLLITGYWDGVEVSTKQGPIFQVFHLELPLLVRRRIPCGGLRCELHCADCAKRNEGKTEEET